MDRLPPELLLQVYAHLKPRDVTQLRATSRRLRSIACDNDLWKSYCFDEAYLTSNFRQFRWNRRHSQDVDYSIEEEPEADDDNRGLEAQPAVPRDRLSASVDASNLSPTNEERTRGFANWDPSYPEENIDWYNEYVARHAPLFTSWLKDPFTYGQGVQTVPEPKGLGLLAKSSCLKAIAPLDDGSVCLWDISHRGHDPNLRGSTYERSKAGVLSVDGDTGRKSDSKAKAISTGVVECISVDSFRDKAYIAAQSGLNEIDLHTLQVSSHERYPFSIAALSEIEPYVPLTVGTTLTLHLHDHRQPRNHQGHEEARTDPAATFPTGPSHSNDFMRLLSGDIGTRTAPLFKPGPLSIVHLNSSGDIGLDRGEIYVAGRFPSIVVYDRRTFPQIRSTLYSGASLSSMTTLPFSFNLLENDLMRRNQLSIREAAAAKAIPGDRVIACGEYHGKGSLEIFGLEAMREETNPKDAGTPGQGQNASFKNRVSAAGSKLLSIANHGTRLVVSDSNGNLRWMERNGSTLVRSWNINQFVETHYSSSGLHYGPDMGDVVRKILPTNEDKRSGRIEEDELLIWTGDRIGVVGFAAKARFGGELEESVGSLNERHREQQPYDRAMRRMFERQADEVRWMRRFGLADS